MSKKGFVFCLVLVLLGLTLTTCSIKKVEESEKIIATPGFSLLISQTLTISPDGRRVAYGSSMGAKDKVVVDGAEGELYDYVSRPIFSPDGKRVAYSACIWC